MGLHRDSFYMFSYLLTQQHKDPTTTTNSSSKIDNMLPVAVGWVAHLPHFGAVRSRSEAVSLLTWVFCGFPQSFQEYAGIMIHIRT
jgi:hypothetical protein